MNIYLSALAYKNYAIRPILDFINKYQKMQLGIELLSHFHMPEYRHMIDEYASELCSIPVTIHGPYLGVDATSKKGTPEFDKLMDGYKFAFEMSQRFNASHIVLHVSENKIFAEELVKKRNNSIENIPFIIEEAKKYGAKIVLENLNLPTRGHYLYTNEEYLQLFDVYKDADCLIDVPHAQISGLNYFKVMEKLGDRVVGYHLHNNNGFDDEHNRINEGVFDYKRFINASKKLTPNANYVLEYDAHNDMNDKKYEFDIDCLLSI